MDNLKIYQIYHHLLSCWLEGAPHHPFSDLVEDAGLLIAKDWTLAIRHIPRESNASADFLAEMGHSMSGTYCFFEEPPDAIGRVNVELDSAS